MKLRHAVMAVCAMATLAGCALPERVPAPLMYDFGEPSARGVPDDATNRAARIGLALQVRAHPALDSSAMRYRLAYADAHESRAYSRARWSMPPAELLLQHLRHGLGRQYDVLRADEAGVQRVLQVELEEFSQIYDSASTSRGVVQLRATVWAVAPAGDRLLGQRVVRVQRIAASPDAAGGVKALAEASQVAQDELSAWLSEMR